MSSSGNVNPLAIIDPQLYAQQLAIQRKQALAAAMMGASPAAGAYGGLASAGKNILGAFLAKSTDRDMQNLYGDPDSTQAAPPQPAVQVSNSAGANSSGITSQPLPPIPGAPDSSGTPSPQAIGAALSDSSGQGASPSAGAVAPAAPAPGGVTPQALGAALGGQKTQNPPDYAALNPTMRHIYDGIPHIPGISARQSVMGYLSDSKGYMTAAYEAAQQTPDEKNAAFANPGDTGAQRSAISAIVTKGGTIPITRGMVKNPDGTMTYAPPPAPAGSQYVTGQNGQPMLVQTQGGPQAVAGAAYDVGVPKALLSPQTGYYPMDYPDVSKRGQPYPSNQLQMSGNGGAAGALGLPGGNASPQGPQQQQPVPQPAPAQPTAAPVPTLRMQNPAGVIGGILGVPVTITSGNRTPQRNAAVGGVPNSAHLAPQNAYDFVPHGMSTAQASALMVQSGVPYDQIIDEGTHVHVSFAPAARRQAFTRQQPQAQQPAAAPQGGAPASPMLPELPAGQAQFMQGQGTSAATRIDATRNLAADTPTRINVLQSILKLSQSGAPTGSTEWQNDARDVAGALSQSFGYQVGADDKTALMTEIHKYMSQYANRMAQAQGGTGTDKQLEAVQAANPNTDMFPATLQRVVPWIIANERGIAAKANAQDQWLQQKGNTATSQQQFENQWRNAYDPRVFQLQDMPPAALAPYIKSLAPADARALLQKRQTLKGMGAIQ